jgi:pimeloyl-ACP methyl ester carboxylesterase
VGHWIRHLERDWDSLVWQPWLSFLSKKYSVIRYDWRGCGLSDRDVDFSPQKHAEDCEAVIEAAGLDSFILFAMAGGGTMAIPYVARRPGRVSHLVLYGPQTRGRRRRGEMETRAEELSTRLKMIELGWSNPAPAFGQFFTALHMPDSTPEQMASHNELLRATTSAENTLRLIENYWDADVEDVVPQVTCPTLVLHSREEAIIPFEEGRRVASLIPGARFVPLDSRNHIVLNTEPAWRQMLDAIEDFLPSRTTAALYELTPRERDVLELVAQGLGNAELAQRLKVSEKTVRNQVSMLLAKVGAPTRAGLVAVARDLGLGRRFVP